MSETLTFPSSQTPVTEHPRFVEGTPENQETLERFVEGLRELQAQNPEIAGATLFGSRLKGESTAKSDVDCKILIDANRLAENDIPVTVDDEGHIDWGKHTDLKKDFESHFGEVLAEKTNKDPSVIKGGIYVEAVSPELIRNQIDKYTDYLKAYDQAIVDREKFWDNPDADFDNSPPLPEQVFVADPIPALFSPDLLHGLEKYREEVVHYLKDKGEYGEKAWQDILERVRFGEGHVEADNSAHYPATLEQANEWYGHDRIQ